MGEGNDGGSTLRNSNGGANRWIAVGNAQDAEDATRPILCNAIFAALRSVLLVQRLRYVLFARKFFLAVKLILFAMSKLETHQQKALRLIEALADSHHELLNAIQRNNTSDVIFQCHQTMALTLQVMGIFLP